MTRNHKILTLISLFLAVFSAGAAADTHIRDLRVQHQTAPLAVEDAHPSFSWRMDSDQPGQGQLSYRIRVRRDSDNRNVWDSGTVRDSVSTGIRYMGADLQPGMGYVWDLTVTDLEGQTYEAASTFETGLMDPRLRTWKGAQWIGDSSPALDAASLDSFTLRSRFIIAKGKTAGFIFGADDFRLKDVFQNSWNLAGKNYFKVVLDLGGYGTNAGCALDIYRVGYAPDDSAEKPLLTIDRASYPESNLDAILKGGPGEEHTLEVQVHGGSLSVRIDGSPLTTRKDTQTGFSVSPAVKHTPSGPVPYAGIFPHLCAIGFVAAPESDVTYTNFEIEAGGRVLFAGAGQYQRFGSLSCIRLPRYRNQSAYENDIVVINKESREVVETIDPSYGGASLLRSEFTTARGKNIRKARLYATACGIYKCHLNGKPVGDDWFAPGPGVHSQRVTYQAYDVTSLMCQGRNALGVELFAGPIAIDPQAFLCRLDVTYEDGTLETFVSRPDGWKCFDGGPVRAGSFSQGERYDAAREAAVKGWSEPGYDDSAWRATESLPAGDPWITARTDEPIRVRETLSAAARMPEHSDDYCTHIYDMGDEIVGVPELHIPAGWLRKGDVVTIRYAKELYPPLEGDAHAYARRYGPLGRYIAGHMRFGTRAMDTDFYIAGGSDAVVIRPRSTAHAYQYIQVTLPSHEGPLPLDCVKGLVLSSCPLPTGTYEAVTADRETGEGANALFSEIRRIQLERFCTLSTADAPRDVRRDWTGDEWAWCRTASYNADVTGFFRQRMTDLRDERALRQCEGGLNGAEVCMVPWHMYMQCGDTHIVEENLGAMMGWLNTMAFSALPEDRALYHQALERTAQMADAVGRGDYARVLRERLAGVEVEPQSKAVVTPNALPALSRAGFWEEAYEIFSSLDEVAPSDLGAVGQWMFEYQLGISPGTDAGYRHFVLQPVAGGNFLSLRGGFDSDYGRIESAWTADGSGRMLSYSAVVPANTEATLYLPVGEGVRGFPEKEGVRFCGKELHNGVLTAVYTLASGAYSFQVGEVQIMVQ